MSAQENSEPKKISDNKIKYMRILARVQKYYIILPLIPTILGSCFLIGYILPAGPSAIQAISYVDIFNFAFIFAILCVPVSGCGLMLSSIYGGMKRSVGAKYSTVFSLVVVALISIFLLYLSVRLEFHPSKSGSLYFASITLFLIMPFLFAFVLRSKLFYDILAMSMILTFSSFASGLVMGSFDYRYKDVDDQVCTDFCWHVGVYTVLSEFVIAIDCTHRVFLFPRSEVKRITMAPAPLDASGILAKAISDDATSCSNGPTPKI